MYYPVKFTKTFIFLVISTHYTVSPYWPNNAAGRKLRD